MSRSFCLDDKSGLPWGVLASRNTDLHRCRESCVPAGDAVEHPEHPFLGFRVGHLCGRDTGSGAVTSSALSTSYRHCVLCCLSRDFHEVAHWATAVPFVRRMGQVRSLSHPSPSRWMGKAFRQPWLGSEAGFVTVGFASLSCVTGLPVAGVAAGAGAIAGLESGLILILVIEISFSG